MKREFFGLDLEEAVQRASQRLGIPVDALKYERLEGMFSPPLQEPKVGIIVEYEEDQVKATPPAEDLTAHVQTLKEQPAKAAGFVLERVLEGMGYQASVEALEEGKQVLLKVAFQGEPPDTRKGDIRELRAAVQYLINRVINDGREGERRFLVDFGGDLADRQELMAQVAQGLSPKVVQLGKIVGVHLMDSQDRRLLHTALVEDSNVSTFSQGEGRFRVLCVKPKGN